MLAVFTDIIVNSILYSIYLHVLNITFVLRFVKTQLCSGFWV